MTDQEMNCKAAEVAFGYRKPRKVQTWVSRKELTVYTARDVHHDDQCGHFRDVETGKDIAGFIVPDFTKDAYADIALLKQVRETWNLDDLFCFERQLRVAWDMRAEDDTPNVLMYETGDYARAVAAVVIVPKR